MSLRPIVWSLAGALVACFPSLPPEVDDDTAPPTDTTAAPPTGAPRILGFDPAPHSVTLARSGTLKVRFDRPMIEPERGEVVITTAQTGRVPGDFSDDVPNEVAFTPHTRLLAGDKVQVTLRRTLASVAGERLERGYVYELGVASAPGYGDFALGAAPITTLPMRGLQGERVLPARLAGDRLDLVVVAGQVSIVRNDGAGGWESPTALDASLAVMTAAVGDVNGDGHLDILVTRSQAPIVVYLGSAEGRFTRQTVTLPGGWGAHLLELGDVDGDGDLDVVAVNGDELALFLNNGDGTFPAPRMFDPGPLPRALALGDMNRDGMLDFIVLSNACCSGSAPIVVVMSDAAEGSWTEVSYETGEGNQAMTVADFDGDGWLDIAVATGGAGAATRVHFNDGAGGLRRTETLPTGLVRYLHAADADGDGWIDLFVDGMEFENTGGGAFDPGEPLLPGSDLVVVAIVDLDADGAPDLIGSGAGGLFLLRNVVDP